MGFLGAPIMTDVRSLPTPETAALRHDRRAVVAWRLPRFALLAAIALAVVGCAGELSDAVVEQVGEPDLRLDVRQDRVGPVRSRISLMLTNAGTVDVLVIVSAWVDSAVGTERSQGPTTRARIIDGDGREISGLAPSAKRLEWVAERVKAGATLQWEVALRCLTQADGNVAVEVRPTTVGSVQEAGFDPISGDVPVACGGSAGATP